MSLQKSICIVGGGSAGWMVAAYLAQNKSLSITLIESDNIPIIGVGESTIPSINDFMNHVGITEEDLFTQCQAVRKYSIQHNNWNGKNESWMHRFCTDESQEYEQDIAMSKYTKNSRKHSYAYHLDAMKLGLLCREKSAIPNGVKHIIDDIVDVITDGNGIKELVGNKSTYKADLYIDCTGFKSLLRSSLGVSYIKHDSLVNNCAIAGPGYYGENEEPLPYTQTFSMKNGWRWRVCLQNRTGNGYVFNKDQISIEQAKKEFIEAAPNLHRDKIFVVPFRNEFNPEPWKKNVVSLGLSCGFLEPLEATGLFLIYGPCRILEKLLNDAQGPKKFNRLWKKLYNEIADFLGMFYQSSSISNEYWNQFNKIKKIESPAEKHLFIDYNYRQLANARELAIVYNGKH
jgi:tryptophan halogenase